MFDFQSAMAEGKARAQRQRDRGQTSSVRMFTSSADRWKGWTKADWEANDMDAAIDDAEAREDMGPDDWSYHLEEGRPERCPDGRECHGYCRLGECPGMVAGGVDAPPAGKPAGNRGATSKPANKATKARAMSPDQYVASLKKLGLTPWHACPHLGISKATSFGYAAGSRPIPATIALLIRALVKLGKPS